MSPRQCDVRTRELRVERHGPASQHLLRVAGRAPDQRAQTRQHLLDPERLRDVVVGAGVDPFDGLVPAAARRQHEHGQGDARLAPSAQQRQTVDPRQAEIEQHGVVAFRPDEKVGALAVGCRRDGVPRLRQRPGELAGQGRLVLDDEDFHPLPL